MKIRVNTKIIESFNPCRDRFDNWKQHHAKFDGDIVKFLRLPDITPADKVWVAVRLMPRFLGDVFAIDCAMNAAAADAADATASYAAAAAAYTAAAYTADAADATASYAAAAAAYTAAAYTADAADATASYAAAAAAYTAAAYTAERQRQIEVLIYLIETTSRTECEGFT